MRVSFVVEGGMRIILALLLIIFPAAFSPALGDASDINAATRSVVRVAVFSSSDGQRSLIGHGSGVVVAPDKIITNAHVISEAEYDESVSFIIIPSEGSKTYEATVPPPMIPKISAATVSSGSITIRAITLGETSFLTGSVPSATRRLAPSARG